MRGQRHCGGRVYFPAHVGENLKVTPAKRQEETRKRGTFEVAMKAAALRRDASRSAAFLLANEDTNSHAALPL